MQGLVKIGRYDCLCANCEERVSIIDAFCGQCGAELKWPTCENCGIHYYPGENFCTSCGHELHRSKSDRG